MNSQFSRHVPLALYLFTGLAIGYALPEPFRPRFPQHIEEAFLRIRFSGDISEYDEERQLLWIATYGAEELDFEGHLSALRAKGLGSNRRAFHELLTLWARRDPIAALAFTRQLEGITYLHAVGSVASGWAESDYKGLAAWLRDTRNDPDYPFINEATIAIARYDPNLAFSLLKDQSGGMERQLRELLGALGKSDPRAAILLLNQLPAKERASVTWSFISTWGSHDPIAAASWVRSLEDPAMRAEALPSLIYAVADHSPTEAARLVEEVLAGDGSTRKEGSRLISSLLHSWTITDAAAAKAWINTLPFDEREEVMQTYLSVMTTTQPVQLLNELCADNDISQPDEAFVFQALKRITSHSPERAAQWLSDNKARFSKSMLPNIVSSVLHQSPELSPQLLPLLTKSSLTDSAYHQAGQSWASSDPERAAAFLETLPPGDYRNAFQHGIFQTTVTSDISKAYAFLENTPDGAQRDSLINTLASESTEYGATAEWIASHAGNTKETRGALSTLVQKWAKAAPAEVATWLQNTPESATKDSLIHSYSSAIVQRAPDAAIQWASTINNEKRRNATMERLARLWLNSDKQAAQEWIIEAPFDEKTKERLLR